jgi:hypothetical protein
MLEELLSERMMKRQIACLQRQAATELRSFCLDDRMARTRGDQFGAGSGDLERMLDELGRYRLPAPEIAPREPLWMPRDAVSALIQSAYDEFFEYLGAIQKAPRDAGLVAQEVATSDLRLDPVALNLLSESPDQGLAGQWLTKFGERDLRFLTWGAAAKLGAWWKGRHSFPDAPAETYPIGPEDCVLLVSDWGSGIPRALQIATAMRSSVEKALAQGRRCHLIHLGDVYYTGQAREYDKRFLEPWPVRPEDDLSRISSWCLNANHDMYSGGYAYFDHLLADPRFARQGRSSHFCLESDSWQIFGLDSAYADGELYGNQARWVAGERRKQPSKAGMLLTHHQPFSDFEQGTPAMLDSLKPVLDQNQIRAWFWGHEHRCALYRRREQIEYPRLIGHGGVPVWAPAAAHQGLLYEAGLTESEYFEAYRKERFLRFGFAELTLHGPRIDVRYVTELGRTAHTETISAR